MGKVDSKIQDIKDDMDEEFIDLDLSKVKSEIINKPSKKVSFSQPKNVYINKEELTESDIEDIKDRFFKRMIVNYGNITKSCDETGITREQYKLIISDPDFKIKLQKQEFVEQYKDMVEWKLKELVQGGDRQATLFVSKTLLKDRGYVERVEHTGKDGKDIQAIKVTVINKDGIGNEEVKIDKNVDSSLN